MTTLTIRACHRATPKKNAHRPAPTRAVDTPAQLERLARLQEQVIECIPNASFDDPQTVAEILAECQRPLREVELPADAPKPRAGLPAYLASLYESTLLTAGEERTLFRQMNFLKHHAAKLRSQLPRRPRPDRLDKIEHLLQLAESVRNELIRSNLRLVVAIARQMLHGDQTFDELVSEGNLALMRAVEKFDFARGFRFSTYATWAVRRAMFHLKEADRRRARRSAGDDALADTPDRSTDPDQPTPAEELEAAAMLSRILPQLTEREQSVIDLRFGLHDRRRTLRQLGSDMGVSKERVRQIELRALSKLRAIVDNESDLPGTTPSV